MVDVIYLVGAERSGTNYLEWLLKANFKNAIIVAIWKHYPPREFIKEMVWNGTNQQQAYDSRKGKIEKFLKDIAQKGRGLPPFSILSDNNDVTVVSPTLNKVSPYVVSNVRQAIIDGTMKFLINVKNPYGWHLSYSKKWSKYVFPNCMDKWSKTYSTWLDFCKRFPDNAMYVKHEDLLKDHAAVLESVRVKFGLKKAHKGYKTTNKVLTTVCSTKSKKFRRLDYYKNEEYMITLKNDLKTVIPCRGNLPDDLMSELGYEKL